MTKRKYVSHKWAYYSTLQRIYDVQCRYCLSCGFHQSYEINEIVPYKNVGPKETDSSRHRADWPMSYSWLPKTSSNDCAKRQAQGFLGSTEPVFPHE